MVEPTTLRFLQSYCTESLYEKLPELRALDFEKLSEQAAKKLLTRLQFLNNELDRAEGWHHGRDGRWYECTLAQADEFGRDRLRIRELTEDGPLLCAFSTEHGDVMEYFNTVVNEFTRVDWEDIPAELREAFIPIHNTPTTPTQDDSSVEELEQAITPTGLEDLADGNPPSDESKEEDASRRFDLVGEHIGKDGEVYRVQKNKQGTHVYAKRRLPSTNEWEYCGIRPIRNGVITPLTFASKTRGW